MRSSTTWSGTLHAISSIAHDGERRGTVALLRRERLRTPEGSFVHVPVVSGNSVRGCLRRLACDLFVEALELEGELSVVAAQLLRGGGGALHRSSRSPLSGERLARLRQLVPPVALFGGTAGARTLSGAVQVGKVVPHLAQTAHLIDPSTPAERLGSLPDVFGATQLETYTRVDDTAQVLQISTVPLASDGSVDLAELELDTAAGPPVTSGGGSGQMLFRVETFPAGTCFAAWTHLQRADEVTTSFMHEVVSVFDTEGRLGGRRGIGHGRFRADWTINTTPSSTRHSGEEIAQPPPVADWRERLHGHRAQILDVLGDLT